MDWGWWVDYLLEKLSKEANNRGKRDEFMNMLDVLKQSIGD